MVARTIWGQAVVIEPRAHDFAGPGLPPADEIRSRGDVCVLLADCGKTQQQIARLLHISQSAVSQALASRHRRRERDAAGFADEVLLAHAEALLADPAYPPADRDVALAWIRDRLEDSERLDVALDRARRREGP